MDEAITGIGSPDIPGLVFRHFQGEMDYPLMAHVVRASERPEEVLDEDIPGALQPTAQFDPYLDAIFAQINGELIGYGRISSIEEFETERVYGLRGYLVPEWRRKGIGSTILGWLEGRVHDIELVQPDNKQAYFRAGVKQHQNGRAIMLERARYQPTRYFYVMVRPTLDNIPDYPLPPGISVRPVFPEDYRAIWKAIDESSKDEWGYHPLSEEWYQWWIQSPSFQPDLWQVGWDISNNTVAGEVLTFINDKENEQAKRKRGYTEGIGVVPGWRRQGLATAMIARSLKALKAAGMEEAGLVVDSQNANGAFSLYERCGFRVVERNSVLRKAIKGKRT
jgi:mycothiol synthase